MGDVVGCAEVHEGEQPGISLDLGGAVCSTSFLLE